MYEKENENSSKQNQQTLKAERRATMKQMETARKMSTMVFKASTHCLDQKIMLLTALRFR